MIKLSRRELLIFNLNQILIVNLLDRITFWIVINEFSGITNDFSSKKNKIFKFYLYKLRVLNYKSCLGTHRSFLCYRRMSLMGKVVKKKSVLFGRLLLKNKEFS